MDAPVTTGGDLILLQKCNARLRDREARERDVSGINSRAALGPVDNNDRIGDGGGEFSSREIRAIGVDIQYTRIFVVEPLARNIEFFNDVLDVKVLSRINAAPAAREVLDIARQQSERGSLEKR